MNTSCGIWIKTPQDSMNVLWPFFGGLGTQAFAEFLRPLWPGKQSVDQRSEIKSRSPDNDRQISAGGNFVEYGPCHARILSGSCVVGRINDTQQMMRYA